MRIMSWSRYHCQSWSLRHTACQHRARMRRIRRRLVGILDVPAMYIEQLLMMWNEGEVADIEAIVGDVMRQRPRRKSRATGIGGGKPYIAPAGRVADPGEFATRRRDHDA